MGKKKKKSNSSNLLINNNNHALDTLKNEKSSFILDWINASRVIDPQEREKALQKFNCIYSQELERNDVKFKKNILDKTFEYIIERSEDETFENLQAQVLVIGNILLQHFRITDYLKYRATVGHLVNIHIALEQMVNLAHDDLSESTRKLDYKNFGKNAPTYLKTIFQFIEYRKKYIEADYKGIHDGLKEIYAAPEKAESISAVLEIIRMLGKFQKVLINFGQTESIQLIANKSQEIIDWHNQERKSISVKFGEMENSILSEIEGKNKEILEFAEKSALPKKNRKKKKKKKEQTPQSENPPQIQLTVLEEWFNNLSILNDVERNKKLKIFNNKNTKLVEPRAYSPEMLSLVISEKMNSIPNDFEGIQQKLLIAGHFINFMPSKIGVWGTDHISWTTSAQVSCLFKMLSEIFYENNAFSTLNFDFMTFRRNLNDYLKTLKVCINTYLNELAHTALGKNENSLYTDLCNLTYAIVKITPFIESIGMPADLVLLETILKELNLQKDKIDELGFFKEFTLKQVKDQKALYRKNYSYLDKLDQLLDHFSLGHNTENENISVEQELRHLNNIEPLSLMGSSFDELINCLTKLSRKLILPEEVNEVNRLAEKCVEITSCQSDISHKLQHQYWKRIQSTISDKAIENVKTGYELQAKAKAKQELELEEKLRLEKEAELKEQARLIRKEKNAPLKAEKQLIKSIKKEEARRIAEERRQEEKKLENLQSVLINTIQTENIIDANHLDQSPDQTELDHIEQKVKSSNLFYESPAVMLKAIGLSLQDNRDLSEETKASIRDNGRQLSRLPFRELFPYLEALFINGYAWNSYDCLVSYGLLNHLIDSIGPGFTHFWKKQSTLKEFLEEQLKKIDSKEITFKFTSVELLAFLMLPAVVKQVHGVKAHIKIQNVVKKFLKAHFPAPKSMPERFLKADFEHYEQIELRKLFKKYSSYAQDGKIQNDPKIVVQLNCLSTDYNNSVQEDMSFTLDRSESLEDNKYLTEEFMTIEMPVFVRTILESIKAAGNRAFLVGGAVRNALLKLNSDDFDIVADCTKQDLDQIVGYPLSENRHIKNLYELHRQDGNFNYKIDILLKERGFDLYQDAEGRDFTINAIYCDGENMFVPIKKSEEHIKSSLNILYTIADPKEVFPKDPIRMLRAINLSSRLNMVLSADIQDGFIHHRDALATLPFGVLKSHIQKMLLNDYGMNVFNALVSYNLLPSIVPGINNEQLNKLKNDHDYRYFIEQQLSNFANGQESSISPSVFAFCVLLFPTFIELDWHMPADKIEFCINEQMQIWKETLFKGFDNERFLSDLKSNLLIWYQMYKDQMGFMKRCQVPIDEANRPMHQVVPQRLQKNVSFDLNAKVDSAHRALSISKPLKIFRIIAESVKSNTALSKSDRDLIKKYKTFISEVSVQRLSKELQMIFAIGKSSLIYNILNDNKILDEIFHGLGFKLSMPYKVNQTVRAFITDKLDDFDRNGHSMVNSSNLNSLIWLLVFPVLFPRRSANELRYIVEARNNFEKDFRSRFNSQNHLFDELEKSYDNFAKRSNSKFEVDHVHLEHNHQSINNDFETNKALLPLYDSRKQTISILRRPINNALSSNGNNITDVKNTNQP